MRFKISSRHSFPDWELKSFRDLFILRYGKDYKGLDAPDGKYPILGTGGVIAYSNTPLYDKESVTIGRKGTINKPFYMDEPFRTVDTLFYTEIKENILPKFLYYLFQTIDWISYSEQTGVPSLTSTAINSIKRFIPSLPEQQKIAEFFTLLDERISKQADKIALLEQYKEGYTQKLFSRELRFKADDGSEYPEWESYTLSQTLKEIKYTSVTNPEKYELLTVKLYGNGIHPTGNFPKPTQKGRPYYKRNLGELLIGRQNFQNGGLGLVTSQVDGLIASNAISGYQIFDKEKFLMNFILTSLSRPSFYRSLESLLGGTGAKELNRSEFVKIKLEIPSIFEQNKISNFLDILQEKIVLEQNKLGLLKKQKQGFLQRIFDEA